MIDLIPDPTRNGAAAGAVRTLPELYCPERESCACGHVEAEHDPIARRYCAATASGELPRGCICRFASSRPVR